MFEDYAEARRINSDLAIIMGDDYSYENFSDGTFLALYASKYTCYSHALRRTNQDLSNFSK